MLYRKTAVTFAIATITAWSLAFWLAEEQTDGVVPAPYPAFAGLLAVTVTLILALAVAFGIRDKRREDHSATVSPTTAAYIVDRAQRERDTYQLPKVREQLPAVEMGMAYRIGVNAAGRGGRRVNAKR